MPAILPIPGDRSLSISITNAPTPTERGKNGNDHSGNISGKNGNGVSNVQRGCTSAKARNIPAPAQFAAARMWTYRHKRQKNGNISGNHSGNHPATGLAAPQSAEADFAARSASRRGFNRPLSPAGNPGNISGNKIGNYFGNYSGNTPRRNGTRSLT